MSSKLVRHLDDLNKNPSRVQLSELSGRSFLTTDRAFKSRLEASFMIDQENAKQLQKIEKRAEELRQKEKRERNILKKLKKIYEEQLKEFKQHQKIAKQALEEKQRQVQMLNMENTQLKQERIQFSTIKDEKQTLNIKNQQLQQQNRRLSQELTSLEQNFKSLKIHFDQQAELLDKGIRQNQIQSQPPAFAIPGSLKQVQQLTRDLEEQRKKQIDSAVKKDEQNLRAQTEQINNCNFMLESLLQQIKKTEKNRESQEQILQDKIVRSQHKLMSLTDELMKKTEELSQAIGNTQQLQKNLKQRQVELHHLAYELKEQQKICQFQELQIQNFRQQIQIHQDSQKLRFQTQFERKEKNIKNFQKLEQKLQKLFEDKSLKEYSNIYGVFSSATADIFNAWNKSIQSNDAGERFIENLMKIIEATLISLNDYLRQKANRDIERIQKMVGFIQNANSVIQRQTQDDDFIQKDDKDVFVESTPQRFVIQPITQSHRRQQSESSARSYKKSIVLQEDIDNAVNYHEQIDNLKEEALQQELNNLKNSNVILDSLNEGSQKSDTIKDGLSESSFARSKVSEMSQVEQTRFYNDKKKTSLINAKLKKKRTAPKPQGQQK